MRLLSHQWPLFSKQLLNLVNGLIIEDELLLVNHCHSNAGESKD
jgi:hypothetical protein